MATWIVVQAHVNLSESLPILRLHPWSNVIVGTAEQFQADIWWQLLSRQVSRAQTLLDSRVELQIGAKQRHDELDELRRAGDLWWCESILGQFCVGHVDPSNRVGVFSRRLSSGDV